MKNKKIVPYLVAAVVVVWGLIIYRVVSGVAGGEDTVIPVPAIPVSRKSYNDYTLPKDTVRLALNYPDPFGLQPKTDTATVKPVLKHTPKMVVSVPVVFNWSFVSYNGYLRNPQTKQLLAMMTINGKTVSLAEGDAAEKLKLIKNMQDSVKVSFEGHTTYLILKSGTL